MKKHKSHARHVFSFLEKNYNVEVIFSEEEEKKSSKKGSGMNTRSSAGCATMNNKAIGSKGTQ